LRTPLRQLGIFCAIGLICFVLGLAVLAGLGELAGVNYLAAYVASFVSSNVAGYLLNAKFTFEVRSDRTGAVRYLAVNLALLCVNTALMKFIVDALGIWYITAAIILAAFNAPLGYLA
jgi:putative flippase GtrA